MAKHKKDKKDKKSVKPKLAIEPLQPEASSPATLAQTEETASNAEKETEAPKEDILNSIPYEAQLIPEKDSNIVNKATKDEGNYKDIEN